MKVFLCEKMSGMSDDYVYGVRAEAEKFIKSKLPNEEIEIVQNYVYPEAPENAPNLWYLGRSIQELAYADAIFFCNDFHDSRGGKIEEQISRVYDLRILNKEIGDMPR